MQKDILTQLQSIGLEPLLPLEYDRIVRCRVAGAKGRKLDGWYILYEMTLDNGTSVTTGAYGNWKTGAHFNISLDGVRLPRHELEALKKQAESKRKQAEKERKQQAKQAAARAKKAWNKFFAASGESAYLQQKRVRGYGVRYSDKGNLVVPLGDVNGGLHGLQIIYGDKVFHGQNKRFWPPGIEKKGKFHTIGKLDNNSRVVFICEGYATGATIYEASGITTLVAFDVGNLYPVARAVRARFDRLHIIFAADDDYLTKDNPGVSKAKHYAKQLNAAVVVPQFKTRIDQKWTDFNDLYLQEGLEAVREQLQQVLRATQLTQWQAGLIKNLQGMPKADVFNIKLVLENDPLWQGVLSYCEFSYRIYKVRKPPFEQAGLGEWSDTDTVKLKIFLSEHYGFSPSMMDLDAVVEMVAKDNSHHPVQDYLTSLQWDGIKRLKRMGTTYFATHDDEYTGLCFAKFMIGAVARVMQPPVKMDTVLILEGRQGMGKSSALKVLGGQWFSDTHFELGDRDGFQQMEGVWFIELAELDSFNRAETTRAKQFFSALTDRFRAPYARRPEDHARQCVFVGTTNQETYLKDVTGNRRYWPVYVHKEIDLQALEKDRDQLFAEAYHLYCKKIPWWVESHELHLFEKEQEKRFDTDVYEDLIMELLDRRNNVNMFTTADIMLEALELNPHQMTRAVQTRVGAVMSRLGWQKKKVTVKNREGKPQRKNMYIRPP